MFFKGHRKLQTQLYLAYLGIILFFLGTFSMFFYVFVSGKLKDEAFERLYNNNLTLKDSVEANIEDMDNVSININYSSIVENTLSYDFNLNQDRNSYKRLADLFVMLNGTNSRQIISIFMIWKELVFRWTLYKSLPISIWNPNPGISLSYPKRLLISQRPL